MRRRCGSTPQNPPRSPTFIILDSLACFSGLPLTFCLGAFFLVALLTLDTSKIRIRHHHYHHLSVPLPYVLLFRRSWEGFIVLPRPILSIHTVSIESPCIQPHFPPSTSLHPTAYPYLHPTASHLSCLLQAFSLASGLLVALQSLCRTSPISCIYSNPLPSVDSCSCCPKRLGAPRRHEHRP